jgi:hypothetical protein
MKRRNSILSLLLVVLAVFGTIALTSACGGGSSEGPASIPTAQTAPTAAGPSGPDRRSTQESATQGPPAQGPTVQAANGYAAPPATSVAQPDPSPARPQDPTEAPEGRQQDGSHDDGDSAAMAATPVAQPAPTQTMTQGPTAVPDENEGEGAAAMVAVTAAAPAPENAAPLFELPNAQGETVSLSSYIGQQPVVLVFYRGFW